MPLGNPIRKQNESRMVSVLATEGQTVFTVQGGYIINHISVFRNGVRLSPAEDFTAGDGSTVTLNNAANIDDRIDFHIFDRFTVQNAIIGAASTQTINGDLVLNGKLFGELDVPSINLAGIATFSDDVEFHGVNGISSITFDKSANNLVFKDNAKAAFGDSSDLIIFHDGTLSKIQNSSSGQLELVSNDIDLRSSTGDKNYFTAQVGGAATVFYNNSVRITTSPSGADVTGTLNVTGITTVQALQATTGTFSGNTDFGAGIDVTGTITSTGSANLADGHVLCQLDSGNGRLKLLNGSDEIKVDIQGSVGNVKIYDNGKFQAGDSNDLSIFHDGSHSKIVNTTGQLKVQGAASQAIIFRNGDDSANVAVFNIDDATHLYYDSNHKFSTTSAGILVNGSCVPNSNDTGQLGTSSVRWQELNVSDVIDIIDNGKIRIGNSDDMQIFHDGTDNLISTSGTVLAVHRATTNASNPVFEVRSNHGATNQIKFQVDGDGDVLIPTDTGKLQLGVGSDLQIFHDGTNSRINNTTGKLMLKDDNIEFVRQADDTVSFAVYEGGSTDLYYNHNKSCETTARGLNILDGTGSQAELRVTATGTNRADIMALATGSGNANLWLDASNGDLSGADYVNMFQHNTTLDLEIVNYANDIILKVRNGSLGSGGLITAIHCEENGKVLLYHDGNMRAQTTTWGFQVEGDLLPQGDNQHKLGESNERWSIVYAANGSINTSDKNEKNTIVESDLGLDFINKLKPISYKWNKDDGKTHYGLIAQDVEETLTGIGKTVSDFGGIHKEDDSPMGIGYSELIAPLIKALQEASAKIETLEAKVAALEGS